MELLLLSFLVLIVNGLVFWLYYTRTKRIIWRIRESGLDSIRDILGRIEHRMAKPLPYWMGMPTDRNVWAVIFTYDRHDLLTRTIASLHRHEPDLKIMVVDNGSHDKTIVELAHLKEAGIVNRILLNRHEDIPQWQKSYAFHQAVNLLMIEQPSHLLFLDDDVEAREPFLQTALTALHDLQDKKVKIVSLLTDDEQNKNHETLEMLKIHGHDLRLKRTFNGAFFLMTTETLNELGLPYVAEGSDEIAAEDWYFSRRLMTLDYRVACFDMAEHLGAVNSKRRIMEAK